MPPLIKGGAVVADRWTLLREAASPADIPAGIPAIVPLALWRAERAALLASGDVGVWLAPTDDPAAIADDLSALLLVAVDFPKFTDGRAYSQAFLLRRRLGFKGDIRATGDVLIDQLVQMQRTGFSSAVLKEGVDASAAQRQFDRFAAFYQGDAVHVVPHFKEADDMAAYGAELARQESA